MDDKTIQFIKDNFATTKTKILAVQAGCSRSSIRDYARKFKLKKDMLVVHRTYDLNHKYFDDIGPAQAYFLGWIMADGCVEKFKLSFDIQARDSELLDKFKKETEATYPIVFYQRKRPHEIFPMVKLRINSSYLTNRLKQLNIIERKTGYEEFPLECLPYKYHFLRGLFDGDGCINDTHVKKTCFVRKFQISSASEKFLTSLKEIFGYGHVRMEKNKNIGNWMIRDRDNLLKIYQNIYQDCNDLYLKRKKDRYEVVLFNMANVSRKRKKEND